MTLLLFGWNGQKLTRIFHFSFGIVKLDIVEFLHVVFLLVN